MTSKSSALTIGVTGTRKGLTADQASSARKWLASFSIANLHHGDCLGADAEVHDLFKSLTKRDPVIHPPTDSSWRAFKRSGRVWTPKPFLERNRDIVMAADKLLVLPKEDTVHHSGGTWYTYRFAKVHGVPITIIWPDGSLKDLE